MNPKRIGLIVLVVVAVGAITALAFNASNLQGRIQLQSSDQYINTQWYKFKNGRTGLYDMASVVTSPVTSFVASNLTSKVTSSVTGRGGKTSKVASKVTSKVISTSTTPVASIVIVSPTTIDKYPCKFSPTCGKIKLLELPEIWQPMLKALEKQDYVNNKAKYVLSPQQRTNLLLNYEQKNNIQRVAR